MSKWTEVVLLALAFISSAIAGAVLVTIFGEKADLLIQWAGISMATTAIVMQPITNRY